ncbi:MAG: hypothetical protein GY870_20515, partial [archaeon]|nr:hypothetical protein [archaeon]
IIAITDNPTTARQLHLVWGVKPVFMSNLNLRDENPEIIIQKGLYYMTQMQYLDENEHVVLSLPSRLAPERSALIGLYYLKDVLKNMNIETLFE